MKLIRSKIPQIIYDEGRMDEVTIRPVYDKLEKAELLRQKILEEAQEVIEARSTDHMAEEIGDLLDVIDMFMKFHDISESHIKMTRHNKDIKKGDFKQFIAFEKKD